MPARPLFPSSSPEVLWEIEQGIEPDSPSYDEVLKMIRSKPADALSPKFPIFSSSKHTTTSTKHAKKYKNVGPMKVRDCIMTKEVLWGCPIYDCDWTASTSDEVLAHQAESDHYILQEVE